MQLESQMCLIPNLMRLTIFYTTLTLFMQGIVHKQEALNWILSFDLLTQWFSNSESIYTMKKLDFLFYN